MAFSTSISLSTIMEVLRDAPIGALVVARHDQHILYANSALERMLGFADGALMHCPLTQLIPSTPESHHQSLVTNYFQNPVAHQMGAGRELTARCADGQRLPVEIALAPQMIDAQECTIAYVSNLGPERQMRRHLEQVLDTLPLGVLLVNSEGIIHQTNRSLNRMFGYSATELPGLHLDTLLRAYSCNVAGYMIKSAVGPQFSLLANFIDKYGESVQFP